ncbi:MAG TPA: glycosyltransferase 87 family protein [Candidatus Acidoferrum sp.]|nr:glycosyltransferase 87 family protein [Candidatus Acidoferrum sp.]
MAASFHRPFEDRPFRRLVWGLVALTGCIGVIVLGGLLAAQDPPKAGFDLNLILDAGRRVAAGTSPYLAGAVGSGTPVESLFFSYPPPVAQAASLIGGLSGALVLTILAGLASIGFGFVAATLARSARAAGSSSSGDVVDVVLPAVALAPFAFPFAVAILFGNLDATFPFVYGALLIGVTGGSRGWQVGGGVALGIVTVAKVHPGALLVWLAIAGLRARSSTSGAARTSGSARPAEWAILTAALGTMAVVVAASLAVGGVGPWSDYLGVVRSASQADIVTPLNIGPASQLALITGQTALAGQVAPIVGVLAVLAAAIAGWFIRSRGLSFAAGTAASLVVLPVTWFHYPVAFLPLAVHAWSGARGGAGARSTASLILAALVVAGLAIVLPVAVWLAVVLVVAAERVGRANG